MARRRRVDRTLPVALLAVLALWAGPRAFAEAPLPPPPHRHFNDGASFVSADVALRLDEQLAAFERRTSHQVVVAIFPRLPTASMEDFTLRTAQSWRVGRKGLDNGAVLFVFAADRKLRLEVGYGLEATLPDAVAHRILDEAIVPRLRAGSPDQALEAGVAAILAAAEGNWHSAVATGPTDVPLPPPPGFHDDAGLLSERDRARVAAAVSAFTAETGCPLTLQLLNGGARTHSGEYGPDLYAGRTFTLTHPQGRPGLSDEERYAEMQAQPVAFFFAFVTARQPLAVETSAFATSSCLKEPVLTGIVLDLEARFPLAPAEALLGVPTHASLARRELWTPPTMPSAQMLWAQQEDDRRTRMSLTERVLDNAIAPGNRWLFVALGVLVVGFLIKRGKLTLEGNMRSGRNWSSSGGSDWGSSGSSSSSSSSDSYSGGGGSFGGGGASGSW